MITVKKIFLPFLSIVGINKVFMNYLSISENQLERHSHAKNILSGIAEFKSVLIVWLAVILILEFTSPKFEFMM